MGALDDKGQPTRAPRQAPAAKAREDRVGPVQYVNEVRDEMRKVAWPHWPEVKRMSIIVLATVILYTAYIGALDSLFGLLSGWLYQNN
jgi:preprotein translocase subunit SecE